MIWSSSANVAAAFDILLEEIDVEIDHVVRAGVRALKKRDFSEARDALQVAMQLTAFRDRAEALQRECNALAGQRSQESRAAEEHTVRGNGAIPQRRRPDTVFKRSFVVNPGDASEAPITTLLARNGSSAGRPLPGKGIVSGERLVTDNTDRVSGEGASFGGLPTASVDDGVTIGPLAMQPRTPRRTTAGTITVVIKVLQESEKPDSSSMQDRPESV